MDLTAVIVVPTVMYFVYKFLEVLIRRKERMMLVEKLETLQPDSLQICEAFSSNSGNLFPNKRFSGLRIGLLLAGIGLGLIVAWALLLAFYPTFISSTSSYVFRQMFQFIFLASPACFGGLGLIISYFIEQKVIKGERAG